MMTLQTLQYTFWTRYRAHRHGMLPPLSCKTLFYICNAPGTMAKRFMMVWKTAAPTLYQEKRPGCHKEYIYFVTIYLYLYIYIIYLIYYIFIYIIYILYILSYSILCFQRTWKNHLSSYMYNSLFRFWPRSLTKFGRPISLSMHCAQNNKRWYNRDDQPSSMYIQYHLNPFSSQVSCHHMRTILCHPNPGKFLRHSFLRL